MARPTFVNIPDTDVDVGSPAKDVDVGQALRDNAIALRLAQFALIFAQDTSVAAAWETVAGSSFSVFLDDLVAYTGLTRRVSVQVELKVDSGTTGKIRIYNSTQAAGGSEFTITGTSYAWTTVYIDVLAGWLDETNDFVLEFYRSAGAGTVYARAAGGLTGRWEF